MKKLMALGLFMVMPFAAASGTVDYLEVKDHIVYFSTSADKSAPPPSCVATDKADQWAVSLNSHQGRAMYSLILSAMAKGEAMGLTVTSAGNCLEQGDVEQANSVQIVSAETQSENPGNVTSGSGHPTFAIYAGDGVTRVATVINVNGPRNFTAYNPDNFNGFMTFDLTQTAVSIIYMEENCTGQPYTTLSKGNTFAMSALGGKYMKRVGSRYTLEPVSRLEPNGECVEETVSSRNLYMLEPTSTGLCGEYMCSVKME